MSTFAVKHLSRMIQSDSWGRNEGFRILDAIRHTIRSRAIILGAADVVDAVYNSAKSILIIGECKEGGFRHCSSGDET